MQLRKSYRATKEFRGTIFLQIGRFPKSWSVLCFTAVSYVVIVLNNNREIFLGVCVVMMDKTRRSGAHTGTLVPAEGNFEEHPYFRVGDRNAGTGILSYENELKTKDGHVLQQSWTVRAAHGRGLPGRFDQDVYVALLHMIDQKGLPGDGWVSFSLYELVDLMGRKHSGRDYMQVRDSLKRMATTSIESVNAFYHRGRKEYLTDTFSLLLEVKLAELEEANGERRDRNRILLSQFFVESYKANYLKHIDSGFYWSLSSPIAKRLYRLIDKKRSGRRLWEVELFSLRDRIPLSNYKFPSKIKEKLAPAHAELLEKNFLEEASFRKGDGKEYASYKIREDFIARKAAVQGRHYEEEEIFCIQRLRSEGMDGATAEELVTSHGVNRVMCYVEALPYQKRIRNPAGWLRNAITNGYDLDIPFSPSLFDGNARPALEDKSLENSRKAPLSPDTHGHVGVDDGSNHVALVPDTEAHEVWSEVLGDFEFSDRAPNIQVWFEGTFASNLTDHILTVVVANQYALEYINGRFRDGLEESLKKVSGTEESSLVLLAGDASSRS